MPTSIPLILTRNLKTATIHDEDSFIVVQGNDQTVRVPWEELKQLFLTASPSIPGSATSDVEEGQIAIGEDGVYTYYNGQWGKAPRVLTNWDDFVQTSRFFRVDGPQTLSAEEQEQGRANLNIVSATTQEEGLVRLAASIDDNEGTVPTTTLVKQALDNISSGGSASGDVIAAYTGGISLNTTDGVKALVYSSRDKDLEVGVGAHTVTFQAEAVEFHDENGNLITRITKDWDPTTAVVDQSYNATSDNAQSGTAVAQAIRPVQSQANALSTAVQTLTDRLDNHTVDQSYYPASTNAQSGTAVAQAIQPVSGDVSALSSRVQVLSDEVHNWTGDISVDFDYSPTSLHPQAGTAVAEALSPIEDDIQDLSTKLGSHTGNTEIHLSEADREKLDSLTPTEALWIKESNTLSYAYGIQRVLLPTASAIHVLTRTLEVGDNGSAYRLRVMSDFPGSRVSTTGALTLASYGSADAIVSLVLDPDDSRMEVQVGGVTKFWVDASGYGPQYSGGDDSGGVEDLYWALSSDKTSIVPADTAPKKATVDTLEGSQVDARQTLTVGLADATRIVGSVDRTANEGLLRLVGSVAETNFRLQAADPSGMLTLESPATTGMTPTLRVVDSKAYTTSPTGTPSTTAVEGMYPLYPLQYNQHLLDQTVDRRHLTDSERQAVRDLIAGSGGGGTSAVQYWTRLTPDSSYITPNFDWTQGINIGAVHALSESLSLFGGEGNSRKGVYIKGGDQTLVQNIADSMCYWLDDTYRQQYLTIQPWYYGIEYSGAGDANRKNYTQVMLLSASSPSDALNNLRTGLDVLGTGKVRVITQADKFDGTIMSSGSAGLVLTPEVDNDSQTSSANAELWGATPKLIATAAGGFFSTDDGLYPSFAVSEVDGTVFKVQAKAGAGSVPIYATGETVDVSGSDGQTLNKYVYTPTYDLVEGMHVNYPLTQEVIDRDYEGDADGAYGAPAHSVGALYLSRYCGTGTGVLTLGQTLPDGGKATALDVKTSEANLDAKRYATVIVGTAATINDSADLDADGNPIEKTVASTFIGPVSTVRQNLLNPATYEDSWRPLYLFGDGVYINGRQIVSGEIGDSEKYFEIGTVPFWEDTDDMATAKNPPGRTPEEALFPWTHTEGNGKWRRMAYSTSTGGEGAVLTMSADYGAGVVLLRSIAAEFNIESNGGSGIIFNTNGPIKCKNTGEINLWTTNDKKGQYARGRIRLSAASNMELNASTTASWSAGTELTLTAGTNAKVEAPNGILDLNGGTVRINGRVISPTGAALPQYVNWSYTETGQKNPQPNWTTYGTIMIDCADLVNKFYTDGEPDATGGTGKVTYNADFWNEIITSDDDNPSTNPMPTDTTSYPMEWTLIFLGPTEASSGAYFNKDTEYTIVAAKGGKDDTTNSPYTLPEVKVGYRTMTVVKVVRHGDWVYGIVQQTS